MRGTLEKIHRTGFLSFILISYIAMTSSMTLDLTELRNKVSKIKVNPRGNLWATGHFMGKKSVVDSSYLESLIGDLDTPIQAQAVTQSHRVQDLGELIIQVLKTALQAQQKQADGILTEEHFNLHHQLLQD